MELNGSARGGDVASNILSDFAFTSGTTLSISRVRIETIMTGTELRIGKGSAIQEQAVLLVIHSWHS